MAVKTARDRLVVKVGETRSFVVAFQNQLESGELLTGTPTVTGHADLTITNKAVNTAILTVDGDSVAVGQAVQFSLSGQTVANSPYTVAVTAGSDATPAQTLKGDVVFEVEA